MAAALGQARVDLGVGYAPTEALLETGRNRSTSSVANETVSECGQQLVHLLTSKQKNPAVSSYAVQDVPIPIEIEDLVDAAIKRIKPKLRNTASYDDCVDFIAGALASAIISAEHDSFRTYDQDKLRPIVAARYSTGCGCVLL